jgi:septum formation protein
LFLKSPPELILASTSKYRRELLLRLGIPFSCAAPNIDESAQAGERASELVKRLAQQKALAVGAAHPAAWIIGSDQVAVRVDDADGETILGKPGSAAACLEQLRGCSGRTVTFMTAVAVLQGGLEGNAIEFTDSTRVMFRVLDDATIERYVSREMPLDCAGGFKSEALGITLFESIVSVDPTALIGLPLIRLAAALRTGGFALP